MTPKELLFAHRYSEAVEAHRNHLLQHPDQNYYPGLGQALLSLKRYSEAFTAFTKANEIESLRVKKSQPYINYIATVLWLIGEKEKAMLEWHRAVAGVLDGTISYGDPAGGGTQGLLLWYAAITMKNAAERDYALEYLLTRVQRKALATCWPRPIIQMIFEEISFADVLKIGSGSGNLDECLKNAKADLLKRRRLCQATFYAACQDRQAGNETECINKMRLCSHLENPILESEWYLACGEQINENDQNPK
jgi:tetratricopeptide (TPR) repeat protein